MRVRLVPLLVCLCGLGFFVVLTLPLQAGGSRRPAPKTLHEAAEAGNIEWVDIFLREGEDPNALNAAGYTPLLCAIQGELDSANEYTGKRYLAVMVRLLECGADAKKEKSSLYGGERAAPLGSIICFVEYYPWRLDMIQVLIEHGARDFEGYRFGIFDDNLLNYLIRCLNEYKREEDRLRCLQLIQWLLDSESPHALTDEELDAMVDDYGTTPLHRALVGYRPSVVRWLVQRRPDWMNAINRERGCVGIDACGYTPLDRRLSTLFWLRSFTHWDIVTFLLEHGARTAAMLGEPVNEVKMSSRAYVRKMIEWHQWEVLELFLEVAGWGEEELDAMEQELDDEYKIDGNHPYRIFVPDYYFAFQSFIKKWKQQRAASSASTTTVDEVDDGAIEIERDQGFNDVLGLPDRGDCI